MNGFNYPIRVLKKKMNSPDFKPYALDCTTGNEIKVKSSNTGGIFAFLFTLIMIIIATTLIYIIVVEPIGKTYIAKSEANEVIASLGGNDKGILRKMEAQSQVISKDLNNGLLQITFNTSSVAEHRSLLKLAFGLSGLKEVYSDGSSLAITLLSSEQ